MTDLYLIAHKVRGEPAFDIAEKVPCSYCQSYESVTGLWCEAEHDQATCIECDQLGFQWVIPTSGHRAYPYWHQDLQQIMHRACHFDAEMPPSLPDHYVHKAAPKVDLTTLLGIRKPAAPTAPSAPFPRRL